MSAATAGAEQSGLSASAGTLIDAYTVLLVDLDGVAYLGDSPIDGAATALAAARDAGNEVVFVTNNASRTPATVAERLSSMGVAATAEEVMTAAVAAAGVLAAELPRGAAVLVVGGAGVRRALEAVGLRPVDSADEHPVAVLQGFSPEVGWAALAEAAVAIAEGAPWTATNADLTLPSPRGPLPGNGSLVAALAAATGQQPRVIGKPQRALLDAAVGAHPGGRPLMVGDRLDTDIAGAQNAGLPSLLVLSGVSHALDLLAAPRSARPQYVGRDLRAIQDRHPAASVDGAVARCGGSTATISGGSVVVGDSGAPPSADGLDGLRALATLAWCTDIAQLPESVYAKAIEGLNLD